jgi:N-acyl-D-aspartate/D-glutamate deacylase
VPWRSIFVRKVTLAKNQAFVDRSLTDLAEQHGKHVADVMLDLALEEGLDTEFQLMTRSAEEETQIADMVKSGHALPSQSDAGAHLNTNFCTAGESSYVLGQWVRDRELMTLEDAIRRLSFQPARILGLRDRGLVREGLAADLMVFDLSSIGVKEDEVTLDGPSGTPRRVQGADGVSHVIVGGQVVLEHGKHTGALPGRVLRAGRH